MFSCHDSWLFSHAFHEKYYSKHTHTGRQTFDLIEILNMWFNLVWVMFKMIDHQQTTHTNTWQTSLNINSVYTIITIIHRIFFFEREKIENNVCHVMQWSSNEV